MGCGGSKQKSVVDENALYKANYDPSRDDKGGKPLSGLISCPCIASMYNCGVFKSIAAKVEAAVQEDWKGWEASPAHCALYDVCIGDEEITEAQVSINMDRAVSAKVTEMVSCNGGVRIFQMHHSALKHGQATRIRYDFKNHKAGFDQQRFDDWWKGMDDDTDGKMSYKEMRQMLKELEAPAEDKSAPTQLTTGSKENAKKSPVFVLLFYSFGGDLDVDKDGADDGIDKSVLESLYQGKWPTSDLKLPNQIGFGSHIANVMYMVMQGAGALF